MEYYSVEEKKWIALEPTAGEIVEDGGCYVYTIELYPEDDDKWHLCVSDDIGFASACAAK